MKLTILFLLAACLQVSAKVRAQQMITLSQKDAPLETVFKEIRKQTGYTFFCRVEWLQEAKKVNISVKNASLEQVLNICFRDQPLTYTIVNKTIMVRPKEEVPKSSAGAEPPGIDLKGRVTNDKGEPLAGATVIIKGSTKGVSTDANGQFELKRVDGDATVVVSFTSYTTMEYKIKGLQFLDARLDLSTNTLDQTVVIAYGTTTKRLNTGDVSTLKSEDIAKQPVVNPLAAMEGRMAGVNIVQNTGVPGGAFTVQIRGVNSIINGNNPLYVIDGVPYPSGLPSGLGSPILGNANTSGAASVGNPLNYINPSDIESIDVLKDADATAIYGSRGANGVVLITTKKGKAGRASVDVNAYAGAGKVTRTVKYLNTQQYLEMRNEALANDGVTADPGYDYDLLSWDTTRYTDWQKQLIGGTARYSHADASVSGGSTNTQYLIGGTWDKQTTVFPGSNADQKGSVHFNVTGSSIDHRFKAALSGSYQSDNNNLPSLDLTSELRDLPPDAPAPFNPDGSLNFANSTWTISNPYTYLVRRYTNHTKNLVSHGELSYEVLPGLELKTSLGYTDLQTGEYTDAPTAAIDPTLRSFVPSSADFANYDYQTWIVEPQASYKVKLGGGKLSALVGGTIEQNTSQGQVLQATGFTSDQLLGNIQAASSIVVNAVTNTQYKYGAIFGRLGYSWMDKYLLDLTARRDGSSRFGPGKQYANFGAAGGAWIFSREEFVQKALPFLSFGKLRASYGTSGNDQIPDYGFMSLYSSTINPFLGSQGIYPYNLANPDYAWEINKKLEGGIELGLFKDRILAGASFYRNRSSSQLVGYPLSTVTGFTSVQANLAAVVQNTGWEFSVTTKNIAGKDFSWTSNINLTIPRNKLLSFPGLASSSYAGSYVIGQPLTIFKAAHSLGADSATGSYVFSDVKGNPTFNPTFPDDYTVLVDLAPKFYGGFENSFRYKGFQLDFLFQFVKQTGAIFISNELPGVEGIQQPVAVLKRWQKPGDKTNIQKFNEDYSLDQAWYDYAENSDGGYGDASYIRLKNLSFSYTLPSSWEHKLHLQNCRVYVQGQNLLTITHYAGMDPENPSVVPSLPPLKVITAGIQLGL